MLSLFFQLHCPVDTEPSDSQGSLKSEVSM